MHLLCPAPTGPWPSPRCQLSTFAGCLILFAAGLLSVPVVCAGDLYPEDARPGAIGSYMDPEVYPGNWNWETVYPAPEGKFLLFDDDGRFTRYNGDGTLDTTFTWEFEERVGKPVVVQPNGSILAFQYVQLEGGASGRKLVRSTPSGAPDVNFDSTLITGGGASLDQLLRSGEGKIYVRGRFEAVGGLSRPGLARLNADGSVDEAYAPPQLVSPHRWTINDICLQGEKLLVGGERTFYDQNLGTSIVSTFWRLGDDGDWDETFTVGVSDEAVRDIAVASDGRVLVSGAFSVYNKTVAPRFMFLASDGTPQPELVRGEGPQTGDLEVRSSVSTVERQGDGWLLAGDFERFHDWSTKSLVRLDDTGAVDRRWAREGSQSFGEFVEGFDGELFAASGGSSWLPTGRVLLPGDRVWEPLVLRQPTAPAEALSLGSRVVLRAVVSGGPGLELQWYRDGEPVVDGPIISGAATGRLVLRSLKPEHVGTYHLRATVPGLGEGGMVESTPVSVAVKAPDKLGPRLDLDWAADPSPDGDYDGGVQTLADGSTLVVVRGNMVRKLDRNGKLLLASQYSHVVTGGGVQQMFEQADGSFIFHLRDYSAGPFATPSNRFVRVDATGRQLLGDTGVITGKLYTAVAQGNRGVLVGGESFRADSQFYHLRRLRPDGTWDDTFATTQTDLRGVGRIAVGPEDEIILLDRVHSLMRLSADGIYDPTFQPDLDDGWSTLFMMQVDAAGRTVVLGSRVWTDGDRSWPGMARYLPDGTLDPDFGATRSQSFTPVPERGAFTQAGDGELYFWGGNSNWLGSPLHVDSFEIRARLGRLSEDGIFDPQFSQAMGGDAHLDGIAAVTDEAGAPRLLVQGDVGLARSGLIRLNLADPAERAPVIVERAPAATLTYGQPLDLHVLASGTFPLTYQWSLDGAPIPGAKAPQLYWPAAENPVGGTYRVTVSNAWGSTTQEFEIVRQEDLGDYSIQRFRFQPDVAMGYGNQLRSRGDGTLWLIGSVVADGVNMPRLALVGADGAIDWSPGEALYEYDRVFDIRDSVVGLDGSLVLVESPDYYSKDFRVIRLSPTGSGVPEELWRGSYDRRPSGIIRLANGDYLLWGSANQMPIRISADGELRPELVVDNLGGLYDQACVVALGDGGYLLGGRFRLADGHFTYLLRVKPDGTVDQGYRPELTESPRKLYAGPGGEIYIAYYDEILRLRPHGQVDEAFSSPYFSGGLVGLTFDAQGRIYVAQSGKIHRLFEDGRTDRALEVSGNLNYFRFMDGRIWGWGGLTAVGHVPVDGVVLLEPLANSTLSIAFGPESTVTQEGRSAYFSVAATGRAPLTYKWYKDGIVLSGESDAILRISDAAVADAGEYQVEVSDGLGRARSEVVELTVLPNAGWAGVVDDDWAGGERFPYFPKLIRDGSGVLHIPYDLLSYNSNRMLLTIEADGSISSIKMPEGVSLWGPGIHTLADGSRVMIGPRQAIPGTSDIRSVLRVTPDGEVDPNYAPNATGTYGGAGFVLGDGRFLFPGSGGIRRLNADGSLDAAYVASFRQVEKMLPAADGGFWIYGEWEQADRRRFALWRLDSEGEVDARFAGVETWALPELPPMDVTPDGGLVALIEHRSPGDYSSPPHLVRWNADGTLDHSFAPAPFDLATSITDLAVDAEGRVILLGNIRNYAGLPQWGLVRLLPDGSVDPSFAPPGRWGAYEPKSDLLPTHVEVGVDGNLYLWTEQDHQQSPVVESFGGSEVGANVFKVHASATRDGLQPQLLGEVEDRSVYSTEEVRIDLPVLAPEGAEFVWFKNGAVLPAQTGPRLLIAAAGRDDAGVYRAQVTASGTTVDVPAFELRVIDSGLGAMHASRDWRGKVDRILPMPDGSILLYSAAGFIWQEGLAVNLLTIRPDGSDARPYLPKFDLGYSYKILDPAVDAQSRVYAGGDFARVGAVYRNDVVRFTAEGEVDESWDAKLDSYGRVNTLAVSPTDGKLVMGGGFSIAGQSARRVVRLTESGGLDPSFVYQSATSSDVSHVEFDGDGILVAVHGPIYRGASGTLARYTPDGSVIPGSVVAMAGGPVSHLAWDRQGRLLVAGTFTEPRQGLFRVDGNQMDSFSLETTAGFSRVLPLSDDSLILVDSNNRLRRFYADGTEDRAFKQQMDTLGGAAVDDGEIPWNSAGSASLILLEGDGQLLVFGAFDHVGAVFREGFFSVPLVAAPAEASWQIEPADQTVDLLQDVTFRATAFSPTGTVSYQWMRVDALETTLSTDPSLKILRAKPEDAGTYRVVASWEGGSLSTDFDLTVKVPVTEVAGKVDHAFLAEWPDGNSTRNYTVFPAANDQLWLLANYTIWHLHSDGALDPLWSPLTLNGTRLPGPDGTLYNFLPLYHQESSTAVSILRGDGSRQDFNLATSEELRNYAVDRHGRIYGTVYEPHRVLRFNADGSLDSSFVTSPTLGQITGPLVPLREGGLLINGSFWRPTGPLRTYVKLTETGVVDPGFVGGADFNISTVLDLPNGQWLVAGFTQDYSSFVYKMYPDGTVDRTFNLPTRVTGPFSDLAVRKDGRILLVANYDGVRSVVQLLPDGGLDEAGFRPVTFPANFPNYLLSFELTEAGDILLETRFGNGSSTTTGLVRLRGTSYLPAVITELPAEIRVVAGDELHLEPWVIGGPPLTYQWYTDDQILAEENTAVLHRETAQPADAGVYHLTISNDHGTVTTLPATVEVLYPPIIISTPEAAVINEGSTVSFTVEAHANPMPSYQWRRNGENLAGETHSTLTLVAANRTQAGHYDVVVSNPIGSNESASATLSVQYAPEIVSGPSSQEVIHGRPVSFTVAADGVPQPELQWFKDGLPLANETRTILMISAAQAEDEGRYTVQASNLAGTVTSRSARLVVHSGPRILKQPESKLAVPGETVSLEVVAVGLAPVGYQWTKDGVPIDGANTARLTLGDVSAADAADYVVVVTDPVDTVTSVPASLTIVSLRAEHFLSAPGYRPGLPLRVNVRIRYSGTPDRVVLSVLAPEDVEGGSWSFASTSESTASVVPVREDTALWEWEWDHPTAGAQDFFYLISVPESAAGDFQLAASLAREDDGATSTALLQPDPLVLSQASHFHSADVDGDFRLSLSELLRVIELYNTRRGTNRTGRYRISDQVSVDGFEADSEMSTEPPEGMPQFHSADTDRDARLGLSELLRVIELYNTRAGTQRTGGYRSSPDSADGFQPDAGSD